MTEDELVVIENNARTAEAFTGMEAWLASDVYRLIAEVRRLRSIINNQERWGVHAHQVDEDDI